MLDLSQLEKSGVTVRKFCGFELDSDTEESVGCSEEAVGEIVAVLEDGVHVPIPVCQGHLDVIMDSREVEDIST